MLLWVMLGFNSEHLPTPEYCLQRHSDYGASATLLQSYMEVGGGTYKHLYQKRYDDLQERSRFWQIFHSFTRNFTRVANEDPPDGEYEEVDDDDFIAENIAVRRNYLTELIKIAGQDNLRKGIFP